MYVFRFIKNVVDITMDLVYNKIFTEQPNLFLDTIQSIAMDLRS